MRAPSPRALFLGSLTLFVLFVIGVLLTRKPAPKTQPQRPPAFAIEALHVEPGAFAASVSWRAPEQSSATLNWGPAGARPLLWASTARRSVRLTGLAPNSRYVVSVTATAQDGETDVQAFDFSTGSIPVGVLGSTRRGAVRADGAPFFPLITWQECPDQWVPAVHDGINLFGGNPCTGLSNLVTAVGGRALVAGTTDDVAGTAGVIGWFYADEADARGFSGEGLVSGGPGLQFLTVTSHFFAQAAPLPVGRGMYPSLLARADVVGFDLYPLQELCRPELLPWVFDAQQALRQLAPGKPTFQWIEEREMKCPQPEAAVSPATIRVESWLAIAGGANGLAFFPPDWNVSTGQVIRGIANRIRQLEPALLQPPLGVAVEPDAPMVRASARAYGGAIYVIAVNAGATSATVRLNVPQLGSRTVVTAGSELQLQADSDVLAVTLPPRTARIYVAAPS